MTARFSFDPSCPWTWRTSRWLVDVADQLGLDVEWRPLSLALLDEAAGADIPEPYRSAHALGRRALRVVAALAAGPDADAGAVPRFYAELGRRLHDEGAATDDATLRAAASAAGVAAVLPAADDTSWDAAVRASHDAAMASVAHGDVGSPVLQPEAGGPGVFGPILSPAPTGAAAVRVWEAVRTLAAEPGFSELKRGRTSGP